MSCLPSQQKKPSCTNPRNHNEGNNNKQSGHETNSASVNDKNPQFNKPAETKSQFNLSQQEAGDSTASNVQSSAPNDSRAEQGDIIIDVNDRFPRDFLSYIFTRAMMSEDTPGIDVLPQYGAGISLNIANHEPQHWSYFQKLARDDFSNKDASHIDQNQLAFSSGFPGAEDPSVRSQLDSANAFVDNEAKDAAHVAQSRYDASQVKISESMQFADMVENMRIADSVIEAELGNVGMLPPLQELDMSSLQIIRNEDLEELRELGYGTFGTVYHGKWRGTYVAIKRIKKSCFAGRSSEQERLTIEFWREADILSKLHHTNVVAFYGVVQDGPGATLATVTELMVDGSLRHVLQRKDRQLDHRRKLIIATDASFGMEYLHSKNIVHFDLKCDNLLVNMKDPSRPICDMDEAKERENQQEYVLLCDWMKQQLGEKVAKVQISNRLSSSPCVLVSGKFGWSANMERLMRAQTLGDTSTLEFMKGRRIMEVNPNHPIIKDLNAACKNAPDSTEAKRVVDLLYETSLISSGFTPDSPAELGGKIYEMMAVALGGRWGRFEESETAEPTEPTEETTSEVAETEVVEPSEVRTEADPWNT